MQYLARPLESLTGYTLEQGSGKLANLMAFSNGKVQVRRDVIKQHCYLTLPLTGYLTPGRESKGRRRPVRANKGVHLSQEQICSGFELLPRLLTHLRPLSFQRVSGESRRKKKQQNIYTLPDQSFVWAIETVAVCFSQSFVFHVWFSVVTSKSFPRKQ